MDDGQNVGLVRGLWSFASGVTAPRCPTLGSVADCDIGTDHSAFERGEMPLILGELTSNQAAG